MPPARFGDFSSERDVLRAPFGEPGEVYLQQEQAGSTKFPNFSYSLSKLKGLSTAFRFMTCCGWRITLYATPQGDTPIRPWVNRRFTPEHEGSLGLDTEGRLRAEYAFTHPAFTVDAAATVESSSVPVEIKASAALLTHTDAGCHVKYDAGRTGVIDYTLGVRHAIPNHLSHLTAYFDSKNHLSVVFSGTCKMRPVYRTSVAIEENGRLLNLLWAMTSPCGRGINIRLGYAVAKKESDLAIGITTPICDAAWKLALGIHPLAAASRRPWLSISLDAQQ